MYIGSSIATSSQEIYFTPSFHLVMFMVLLSFFLFSILSDIEIYLASSKCLFEKRVKNPFFWTGVSNVLLKVLADNGSSPSI